MEVKSITAKAPVLQKLPKKGIWEYAKDWKCRIQTKKSGIYEVVIRKGYWTDLASVPQALKGAFDNGSGDFGVLVASQVHDMLYSTHYMSKDFADDLFYEILIRYGMSAFKAKLYWLAVNLFGGDAWECISDAQMETDRKLCSFKWMDR